MYLIGCANAVVLQQTACTFPIECLDSKAADIASVYAAFPTITRGPRACPHPSLHKLPTHLHR